MHHYLSDHKQGGRCARCANWYVRTKTFSSYCEKCVKDSFMITEVGPHKVRHGNITEGLGSLMNNEVADLIYSDPPWGPGNLKYWETIRSRHEGTATTIPVDYQRFLSAFMSSCALYTKNVAIIEYGLAWADDLVAAAEAAGFKQRFLGTMFYKAGSQVLPNHLHVFSKTPIAIPVDYDKGLTVTDDLEALTNAALPFATPNGIVLDPCCGMGYTAQFALNNNMIFRGNELNAKRLEKTIARLRRGRK